MKACNLCKEEKDHSQFYVSKTGKDGYMARCITSVKDSVKYYRNLNKEKVIESKRNYYLKNTDEINEKNRLWYENNKEKCKEQSLIWAKNNKDKRKLIQQNYYANGGKEKKQEWANNNKDKRKNSWVKYAKNNPSLVKETASRYVKLHKKIILHKTRLRQFSLIKATPKWANIEKIKFIYMNCPKGMHVDHIIPINNRLVCGLHVETNLQYLTAFENLSKGNKFNI